MFARILEGEGPPLQVGFRGPEGLQMAAAGDICICSGHCGSFDTLYLD